MKLGNNLDSLALQDEVQATLQSHEHM